MVLINLLSQADFHNSCHPSDVLTGVCESSLALIYIVYNVYGIALKASGVVNCTNGPSIPKHIRFLLFYKNIGNWPICYMTGYMVPNKYCLELGNWITLVLFINHTFPLAISTQIFVVPKAK